MSMNRIKNAIKWAGFVVLVMFASLVAARLPVVGPYAQTILSGGQ
jgi:hypothetical protein